MAKRGLVVSDLHLLGKRSVGEALLNEHEERVATCGSPRQIGRWPIALRPRFEHLPLQVERDRVYRRVVKDQMAQELMVQDRAAKAVVLAVGQINLSWMLPIVASCIWCRA